MFPILVIDDDAGDAALAERALRGCKIQNPIQTFLNGEEAVRYFVGGFKTPVLVLLDLVMQPVSGIDVLREVQKRGLTEKTVFVMLSGLADYRILQEGYRHGARTFLVKPLQQEDVLQLINTVPGLAAVRQEGGYAVLPATQLSGREDLVKLAGK
jgi:CheY-like chemotaxis protein